MNKNVTLITKEYKGNGVIETKKESRIVNIDNFVVDSETRTVTFDGKIKRNVEKMIIDGVDFTQGLPAGEYKAVVVDNSKEIAIKQAELNKVMLDKQFFPERYKLTDDNKDFVEAFDKKVADLNKVIDTLYADQKDEMIFVLV